MKINYFLIKQIKINSIYILTVLISILLTLFSVFYFFNQRTVYQQQKNILENEISNLESKKNLILTALNLQNEQLPLDDINRILNLLIPNEEDYFSIIFALERISQKTGFLITGYEINLQKSNSQKLSLSITGIGNRNAFMDFIKDYQFIGKRLITIDSIKFSEEIVNQTKIDLNFYNSTGIAQLPTYHQLTKADKELLKKILSKTELVFQEETLRQNYETKTNPF
jgi:hypothetical protein